MTAPDPKSLDAVRGVVTVCDALTEMAGTDFHAFAGDQRTQWAVEMGLIRIGEGVNRISPDVLARFPDQPWRQILAMRNLAVRQHDDLDPRRVWATLMREIPSLRVYLEGTVIPGLETVVGGGSYP